MSGPLSLSITYNRPFFQAIPYPQQAYVLLEANPNSDFSVTGSSPINLCLILDRSGSMAGEKLWCMKEAVKHIVDRLKPSDRLSVIVFDDIDPAEIVISSTLVKNQEELKRRVDTIEERGGTHLSTGMRLGLQEVQQGQRADRISNILLLTDGQTWEDQQECRELADQFRQVGVPLYLFGLGVGEKSNWDPGLLEDLAQRSGGEWMVIETPEQVSVMFEKMLKTFRGIAITKANLTLRLGQGVTPRAVWRVSPLISRLEHHEVSEQDIQVFLGDLQLGVGQSILAELIFPPRPAGTYRLGQADIQFDLPGDSLLNQKAAVDLFVTFVDDAEQANQMNHRLMNLIERVVVHKLQTQALDEAALGDVMKATQRLRAVATRLLELGEVDLAQQAEQQALQIEQRGQVDLASAQKMRYATKRLVNQND